MSAFDLVCLDGRVQRAADARIDPRDPAVTGGVALIETLAIVGGAPLALEAHAARLAASERAFDWPVTPLARLREEIAALVTASGAGRAALRVLRSPGAPGAGPTRLLDLRALPAPPAAGVRLAVETGPLAQPAGVDAHKHTGRLARHLLRERARARGAWDALLVAPGAGVLEATAANVIVVDAAGRARTPTAGRDGVLPGVVRGHLVAAGLVEEGPLALAALEGASEVLVTSSLVGVLGATALLFEDGRSRDGLPGAAGPRARALRTALGALDPCGP